MQPARVTAQDQAFWAPHLLRHEELVWAGRPDHRRMAIACGLVCLVFILGCWKSAHIAFLNDPPFAVACPPPADPICKRHYVAAPFAFWGGLLFLLVYLCLSFLNLTGRTRKAWAITGFRVLCRTDGLFAGLVDLRRHGLTVRTGSFVLRLLDTRGKMLVLGNLSGADRRLILDILHSNGSAR